MSEARFYHRPIRPGELELDPLEAHHAVAARRLQPGDPVVLFDGAGCEGIAEVCVTNSRRFAVRVRAVRTVPRSACRALTVAVAPPKQARQDELVEKCTELGVTAIQPLCTERCVATPDGRRLERWRRVSIAAAKQSGQAWLPDIREPVPLPTLLSGAGGAFELILLADLSPSASPLPAVLRRKCRARTVLGLIGPEGGFSDAERQLLLSCGAQAVRITPTTLRVETAAIALAAVVLSLPVENSD